LIYASNEPKAALARDLGDSKWPYAVTVQGLSEQLQSGRKKLGKTGKNLDKNAVSIYKCKGITAMNPPEK